MKEGTNLENTMMFECTNIDLKSDSKTTSFRITQNLAR